MTRPPSPFEIEQAMAVAQAVKARLLQEDPDLSADETTMRDTLDGETDVFDVIRKFARFALEAEAQRDAAEQRAERLYERVRRFEARKNAARGAILGMMQALEQRKLEDPEFTLSVRPPSVSVVITDEGLLPREFVRLNPVVDRAAIGKELKAGRPVPGADLAHGLPSLMIKST